jgi:hypothetical protein
MRCCVSYFSALEKVFAGRVAGGADLVCYWFEKARIQLEKHGLGAAGFVATQAIRAGSNRQVLSAITKDFRIFDAWADEEWVNDGAAVRVSLVSFGWGECCFLNGEKVAQVTADLRSSVSADMTSGSMLTENTDCSFEGTKKYGDFDISGELARQWLKQPNPHGKPNSDVVKPWRNGQDLSRRSSDTWIIDFGATTTEAEAALYELPFAHIARFVKPERLKVRNVQTQKIWWVHERPRVSLRTALNGLPRYIATPRVSKHRFFVFLDNTVLPDTRLNVITRADDLTFGILSSRIHEAWSLVTCSWIGVGNDPIYNAKSCFETFPFPAGLTPQDTASQQTRRLASGAVVPDVKASTGSARTGEVAARTVEAIAEAAHKLTTLRDNWLNPPDWTQRLPEVVPLGMATSPYPDRIVPKPGHEKELSDRTLTKLYNARPAWLSAAHAALDAAVATAYGWTDYTAEMADEVILQRLLALNVERSVGKAT